MPNILESIPEKVRENLAVSWLLSMVAVAVATAVVTYAAVNATTLAEMRGRNDGLLQQTQQLTLELQTLQGRYDKAVAGRDEDVSKKVSDMASVYRDSLNTLSTQYAGTLKENQALKNALEAADSGERQRAAQQEASRVSAVNEALQSNSNRIAETHRLLYETSATAAYYARDCQKNDGGSFSNLCEQAAKYAAQADSLREQIGSLEKNADILNAQILALDGSGPEKLSGQAQ